MWDKGGLKIGNYGVSLYDMRMLSHSYMWVATAELTCNSTYGT